MSSTKTKNIIQTNPEPASGTFWNIIESGTSKPPVNAPITDLKIDGNTTGGEGTPSVPVAFNDVASNFKIYVNGKNFFDKNNIVSTNTAQLTLDDSGNVISGSGYKNEIISILCRTSTTYTVKKTGGTTLRIASSTIPANSLTGGSVMLNSAGGINTSPTSATITTASTAKYLVVQYYHGAYDTALTAAQIRQTLQIELGSTATVYTPFRGATYPYRLEDLDGNLHTLKSLPNGVKDTYDRDNNRIIKRVGIKIFNGTETGWIRYHNSPAVDVYWIPIADTALGNQKSICTHFVNKNYIWGLSDNFGFFSDHPTLTNKYFNVGADWLTTVDDWKSWLAAQYSAGTPLTLMYELATPETIQIKPYNASTFAYNQRPQSVQTVTNLYTDSAVQPNVTGFVQKLGNRPYVESPFIDENGDFLVDEDGNNIAGLF